VQVTTDGTEGRWLTYDELAEVRGIRRIGAVRLAQKRRWRRQPGNDGRVRVLVPPDALAQVRGTRQPRPKAEGDREGDRDGATSVAAAFERALTAVQEAHAVEVGALREQLGAAEKARAEAQGTAESLRQADAARKARGRLRRAWDGWKGR
jgi:hypothetical protein